MFCVKDVLEMNTWRHLFRKAAHRAATTTTLLQAHGRAPLLTPIFN